MVEIKELDKNSPERYFAEVEKLFRAMYDYMNQHGLKEKLIENGEKLWLNSTKPTLKRLSFLAVAIKNDEIVGFALGSLKIMPEYLGFQKVGFISHVFVSEKHRRNGIAEKLSSYLESIFEKREVDILELEVLTDNNAAISFWENVGYKKNLMKMRKK